MNCEVSCDYANGLLSQLEKAESECAALRAEVEHLRGESLHPCGAREAELAELRAEVERLREEKRLNDTDLANWRATASSLAAATESELCDGRGESCIGCCDCNGRGEQAKARRARTESEQRVLDACRDAEITNDAQGRPRIRGIDQVLVARAELARREAAK